jgi:iron complex transport system ATP-binding protein
METIAISAHQISASLGSGSHNHPVLHGVSLSVPAGRWLSIVGPNGAGKSTLLKCLGGLLPCSGRCSCWGKTCQFGPRVSVHGDWLAGAERGGRRRR